jgi:hypothetical protein
MQIIPGFADDSQAYQYRHGEEEACNDVVPELLKNRFHGAAIPFSAEFTDTPAAPHRKRW